MVDFPNRVVSTRYPASGSEYINSVTRRPSQTSQGPEPGRVKTMMKRVLSLPAY